MPVVINPIQCVCCRGSGKLKPISAFEVNKGILLSDCLNCLGKGTVDIKVYVNPSDPAPLPSFSKSPDLSAKNHSFEAVNDKEVDSVSMEISKCKFKKKDKHNASSN